MAERLQQWPPGRLRSEGLVLLGLRGAKRGTFFGKLVLVFRSEQGGELPFHRFTWVAYGFCNQLPGHLFDQQMLWCNTIHVACMRGPLNCCC